MPEPDPGLTKAGNMGSVPDFVQPTSTDYSGSQSFRHYLQCLRSQCATATCGTYRETRDAHYAALDQCETTLALLHRLGVRGPDRDFGRIVDVNEWA